MRKGILAMTALAVLILVAAPAVAAEPLNRVTYGGWAVTVNEPTTTKDVVDANVTFAGVGMNTTEGWRGQGTFMDRDNRLKAHLDVTYGWNKTYVNSDNIRLDGTADVTIDNVRVGTSPFKLWLTITPTGVETYDLVLYNIPGVGAREWYIKGHDVLNGSPIHIT